MIVHVKNKFISLRGGSDVVNDNNEPVYKVKGKWPSLRKRKYICTLDGTVLYEVRNKFWHFIYPSAFIFNSEKEKIAKVKKKIMTMRTQFFVEGNEHEYVIDGNWVGWNLSVLRDGTEIGKISRNFDMFKDSFTVEADEENMPFMIALVIAIDNMQDKVRNERS